VSLHPDPQGNPRHGGDASGQSKPLLCRQCGSAERLSVTSITELSSPVPSLVEVSYICALYGSFQCHIAQFLGQ
jgi:hypothetical protein